MVVRTGKPGTAAVIPKELPVANCADLVIVRPGPELDARFLSYYVNSAARGYVSAHLVGAVQQHFNVGSARELRIRLPPITEQHRIVAVLAALDDKIESNRRLAAVLEETAAALFKARFVEFVGVEEFEESEIGPIPKDWRAAPLSALVTVGGGGTPPTGDEEMWDGAVPWISIKDISDDPWIVQTERTVTDLAVARRKTKLYPAGTAVISARGTVGSVGLMSAPMSVNQSCYAVRSATVEAAGFVYFLLTRAVEQLRARAHGSVFSTITTATFGSVQVPCPPDSEIREFWTAAEPLFASVLGLAYESTTLAAIRDELLPKLISGEIRVPASTAGAAELAEELVA